MTKHTDPVCGMKLDKKDAAGLDEYQGKTYYFDSEECMILFHEVQRNTPKRRIRKRINPGFLNG